MRDEFRGIVLLRIHPLSFPRRRRKINQNRNHEDHDLQSVPLPAVNVDDTEYQSSVTGAIRKPRTGHMTVSKTPVNQSVSNHRKKISPLGMIRAIRANMKGMAIPGSFVGQLPVVGSVP